MVDLAPGGHFRCFGGSPAITKFSKTQACQNAFKFLSELIDFKHFSWIWLQVAILGVLDDPPTTKVFQNASMPKSVQIPFRTCRFPTLLVDLAPGGDFRCFGRPPSYHKVLQNASMPKSVQILFRTGRFRTLLVDLAPGGHFRCFGRAPATTKFSKTQACQKAYKFLSELVDFGQFGPIWLQVAILGV